MERADEESGEWWKRDADPEGCTWASTRAGSRCEAESVALVDDEAGAIICPVEAPW